MFLTRHKKGLPLLVSTPPLRIFGLDLLFDCHVNTFRSEAKAMSETTITGHHILFATSSKSHSHYKITIPSVLRLEQRTQVGHVKHKLPKSSNIIGGTVALILRAKSTERSNNYFVGILEQSLTWLRRLRWFYQTYLKNKYICRRRQGPTDIVIFQIGVHG